MNRLIRLFFGFLMLGLGACTVVPTIETKRDYDEDKAMQFYLTEKKTLEPQINSALRQCSSISGSLQLHWHLDRQGKATEISVTNDSLNCPELVNLLKNHLSGLNFPKPQPLDRVDLDYVFNLKNKIH